MKQQLLLSILFTFLCLCSSNLVLNGATGFEKTTPSIHKVDKQNTGFSILKKQIKNNIKKVFSKPKDKTKTGLGLALLGLLSIFPIVVLGVLLVEVWPAIFLIGSACLLIAAFLRSYTILRKPKNNTEEDKKTRMKAMAALILSGTPLIFVVYRIILSLVGLFLR